MAHIAVFKLLDLLDPASWLFRGVAALVLAGAMWWAWTGFKAWVSAPAVAKAVAEQQAISEPIIKKLGETVAQRDKTIASIEAASNAEKARQIVVITRKTKELNHAIAQNKAFKTDLAKLRSADADFQRLLDTITANNNSATGASASARFKRLGIAHSQCESALREADGDNAETLGRLDEALAVVRALKQ